MTKLSALKLVTVILLVCVVESACNLLAVETDSDEGGMLDIATETPFSFTTKGGEGEGENLEDLSDEEDESCPDAKFQISADHVFDFSPGRATDQILINGGTLPGMSCMFGLRDAESQPGECKITYTNDGYYQTDADKCYLTGQSQAIIEVSVGCEGGKYVLEISDIPDPDAGIGGVLDCPTVQKTFPNVTFYPPTLTTVSFPTSEKSYSATEQGPSPLGFEYFKNWDIEVITDAPCEAIRTLQLYADDARKRMEFYEEFANEATSASDLDRRVQEAMDEYYKNAVNAGDVKDVGSPQSAGHYDPCGDATINVYPFCDYGVFDHPLCEWLEEGARAHENQHQSDATGNDGDTWTYCHTEGGDEVRITSEWEVNAYREMLRVYNEILDIMRDLFPECFE